MIKYLYSAALLPDKLYLATIKPLILPLVATVVYKNMGIGEKIFCKDGDMSPVRLFIAVPSEGGGGHFLH